MTSIINARTDSSISPRYTGDLLWATCTAEKKTVIEAINDPQNCSGVVDNYQAAGKAVRLFSNHKGRPLKDKLAFAEWLFEKGGFQYPKVLVLTEEMRQPGTSPRRVDQLATMADEAAAASQDPNETASGVAAVANAYVKLGRLDRGQAHLVSLQKQYCHYAGSQPGIRTVETDLCYNRETDYSAVVWAIVDKQLSAGQYEEAFKTTGAVPMSPTLRTDLYLTIAGKALDEKADPAIATRALRLAESSLAGIKSPAARNLYQTELAKLQARAK